ncbi:molecular chaperone [Bradyrhizobium sp. TZ2]
MFGANFGGMTMLIHTPPEDGMGNPKPREVGANCESLELANPIGTSQLSVSNVLPQRALSVEAVMEAASAILWPEPGRKQPTQIDELEGARAREYSLLAMLLRRPPDAAALDRIAKLRGDATTLGLAHLALAQEAGNASAESIEREYSALFIGVGRGELLPYGSYYLTGFLNERPLARLRKDLRVYGIERTEGQAEPEDHGATLCEIMAGMANGQFRITFGMQQRFFEKHLASWMGRFFVDLEKAQAAHFYRQVGGARPALPGDRDRSVHSAHESRSA